MNIWYIHPYAGSPKYGMSFRPYYLAKHFNKLGHNTTVISSLKHHLCSLPFKNSGLADVEGVQYFLQNSMDYQGNGIKRLLNMLMFGLGLFGKHFRTFSKINPPDVIIASTAHPFHLLAAKYYSKKYNAKLILEVRDIWPLSLQELVGISKYHPLSVLINAFQKFGYKKCDHCVSLLENSESFFLNEGLKKGKFSCIPNGIELSSEHEKEPENSSLKSQLSIAISNFDTVIGYTGALGIPNNLMPLINAAEKFKKYNIGVLLVGDGVQKKALEERMAELQLDNVVFFGKVPKTFVPYVIDSCDAMFINAMPKDLYKFGISPNKIFDYMLHDKLVFNGIDSPNNPLEKAGCEINFPANDSLSLANKVIDFHKNKENFSINSSEFVRSQHSYAQLAKNYESLMESLVR